MSLMGVVSQNRSLYATVRVVFEIAGQFRVKPLAVHDAVQGLYC